MPFTLLYAFSDLCFLLLFYLIGYRKKVVFDNLKKSFPNKTEQELVQIQKKFYRYFCDLVLETFKTLTISKKAMLKHCSLTDEALKLLNEYARNKENVILVLGHKGNWEWAGNAFALQAQQKLFVIYHPLENHYFDQLMYRMRSRFGVGLIPMKDTLRKMLEQRTTLNATAFIADQTPQPQNAYWADFLHQDTPLFLGTEKIALKLNLKVLYVSVKRVKRGVYQVDIKKDQVLDPKLYQEEGSLTKAHLQLLENDIIQEPYTWLWTHKRWKYKRP